MMQIDYKTLHAFVLDVEKSSLLSNYLIQVKMPLKKTAISFYPEESMKFNQAYQNKKMYI